MTQPVAWPPRDWGGGPNVYDIRSYGATLQDIGPAVLAAMNDAILRSSGGVVLIPDLLGEDTAWICNTPVAFDVLAVAPKGVSQLTLRGNGSRINYTGPVGSNAFSFANLTGKILVEGLVFEQPQWQSNVSLSNSILNFSSCGSAVVDRCSFNNTTSLASVVAFGSINGLTLVNDCNFAGAGSLTAGFGTVGIVSTAHQVKIAGCSFIDGASGSSAHILLNDGEAVEISTCFFDELVTTSVRIAGASGVVGSVGMYDCYANRPLGSGGFLVVDTCQSVEVRNFVVNGFSLIGTTAFDLHAVNFCRISGSVPIATTPTNILVRANVGQLILDGSPGWTPVLTGAGMSWPTQRYAVDSVNQPYRVNHAGSPWTILQSQTNLYADVSGGAITGNIPAANTMPDGWPMELRRTAGSFAVNNFTLTPAAGTIMDPQNPGNAPAASVVLSTNINGYRWRAGATENVWELA